MTYLGHRIHHLPANDVEPGTSYSESNMEGHESTSEKTDSQKYNIMDHGLEDAA